MNLNDKSKSEVLVGAEGLLERQVSSLEKWNTIGSGTRKALIARRRFILSENFGPAICHRLGETYSDPTMTARMENHVGDVMNVGADITRELANVYHVAPRRRIQGDKEASKKLIKLNTDTGWLSRAQEMNRRAWFEGPMLEIPMRRGQNARRELFSGDRVDVAVDPEDPCGEPVMAAFPSYYKSERAIYLVDEETVTIYSSNKEELEKYAHGVVDEDGDPRFPGTLWRFRDPEVDDYWNKDQHRRLVDGTITCGVIYTALDWVRKTQNRKILTMIGALLKMPPGQIIDNETPILWETSHQDPNSSVNVVDFATSVDEFHKHIMLVTRTLVESYGVPQSAITYDFASEGAQNIPVTAIHLQHEKLTKLRRAQLAFAERYERKSTYNYIAFARRMGLRSVEGLPELSELDESLLIEFPPLTRSEDPKTFREEADWQLSRGHTTDAELYQLRNPHLTLEECEEELMAKLKVQSKFNEFKASRELNPAAEMQDDNQRNGAMRGDPQADDDQQQPEEDDQ